MDTEKGISSKRCCFCMREQRGLRILFGIGILCSLISIAGSGVALYYGEKAIDYIYQGLLYANMRSIILSDAVLPMTSITGLTIGIIMFIGAVAGMIGTCKKQPFMLLISLIMYQVFLFWHAHLTLNGNIVPSLMCITLSVPPVFEIYQYYDRVKTAKSVSI